MKKIFAKLFTIYLIFVCSGICIADNDSDGQVFLRKAKLSTIKEQQYDYLNSARILFEERLEKAPADINTLIALSQTYQLMNDRANAKLYVFKAYNIKPDSPQIKKELGDFFYCFGEYSTAIEYYKAALSSGLLRNYETNIKTAKCYEKLGDLTNAELYYKISLHINSSSREAMNKINEYDSAQKTDNFQKHENAKYKYLFKDKKLSRQELADKESIEIIENLNNFNN